MTDGMTGNLSTTENSTSRSDVARAAVWSTVFGGAGVLHLLGDTRMLTERTGDP